MAVEFVQKPKLISVLLVFNMQITIVVVYYENDETKHIDLATQTILKGLEKIWTSDIWTEENNKHCLYIKFDVQKEFFVI